MSGIYIKGMEMPDNCTRCDYIGLNVAVGCQVMSGTNGRAVDCPLIFVPDHGRLIDADAIQWIETKTIEDNIPVSILIKEQLESVPTIIPADKDGET